jgi:hypothetical protein
MNDYDRVTDVLKPFSGMDKIPKFILEEAAKRGKEVHLSCESIVKGMGRMPIKQQWEQYVDSFLKWYDPDCKWLMPERLFCDELKITGLVDLVIEFEGRYYLYDLKTSAQENITWPLQLSAYSYLLNICSKIIIDKMYVVILKKDGSEPEVKSYAPRMFDFEECLNIYRLFFKTKKPEIDIELI